MAGGRGVVRRTKTRKPYIKTMTDNDTPVESLESITDRKVRTLEHEAVRYLEEELRILTSTPGNFSEVARILKVLKDHQEDKVKALSKAKGKGNASSVRTNASDQIKSWSLDDK